MISYSSTLKSPQDLLWPSGKDKKRVAFRVLLALIRFWPFAGQVARFSFALSVTAGPALLHQDYLRSFTVSNMNPTRPDEDEIEADHPDLRLRITRTLTETIHEGDREDERRKVGKRRKPFGPRRTIFGTIKKDKKLNRSDTTSKQSVKKDSSYGDEPAESPSTALGLEEQQAKAEKFAGPDSGDSVAKGKKGKKAAESRRRRNIYVNMPLRPEEVDRNGQPLARWARNKVRTSKYTLWSFVPKV